ncbi:MAG TPA: hypothetical protein VGN86_18885 [Pyrinomonadaceae bacterium]|nr:hypothetical protein [Pyrinomonadaceae bacterium]
MLVIVSKNVMKRIAALALFTLFCGVSAFPQNPPEPTTSKNSSPEVWQTYELAKGNFTVLFPRKPIETISTEEGITNYIYTSSPDENLLLAAYSLLGEDAEKWSEESTQSFYEGFWDGFSKTFEEKLKESNIKTKLESQQKATLAGHEGIEFKFLLGPYRGRFLITKVGRHSYSVATFATETFSREDQDKFVNSYKILTAAKTEPGKP